ncbi:unnamed protein product [Hyaloperonospora brassicae]|uniref:Uncharacterized protein n=1 Tax=Hyaloperonospora brassicae TaxID=162125 RepID=A0AAV0T9W0_HYABA|nr:unnamed protein product [Hyaloperonospora brassicae]
MEVRQTTKITTGAAAKILKKFVDNNEEETNTDLMMNEEVKFQLLQVLAHLEGRKPQIELPQKEDLYGQY